MERVSAQISVVENDLQFKDVSSKFIDGVELEEYQKEYLLPHFLMLLVGKPGSGKTTLLKQLITNKQMYKQKFNHIILVSPSHAKMGINVDKKYVSDTFSLEWLFQHFDKINEKQMEKLFGHSMGGKNIVREKKNGTGQKTTSKTFIMNDSKSRFITSDFLKKFGMADKIGVVSDAERQSKTLEQMYKEIARMPYEKQRETHCNVLVILDDVVSDIKKEEMNPRLAQLVMNRRHIVLNGTVSIIMVTQKYTLIPARVRSNASWLVLFQLNPLDFENVYRDVVVQDLNVWRDVLRFIFGETFKAKKLKDEGRIKSNVRQENEQQKEEEKIPQLNMNNDERRKNLDDNGGGGSSTTSNKQDIEEYIKNKKYENLGIWVEYNIYFKNFKRLQL